MGFERPFWELTPPSFEGDGNRRIAERAHVEIPANLRQPGRTAFAVTLRDLSRTGCRGETLSRLHVGERVWVTLPGFAAIEGTLRWVERGRFGCEWLAPLHHSVHEHICRAFPELPGS